MGNLCASVIPHCPPALCLGGAKHKIQADQMKHQAAQWQMKTLLIDTG